MGVGSLEGLEVKGWGPGRHYIWRPPGTGTLDLPLRPTCGEACLPGQELSRQWTEEAGPMRNKKWDKVYGKGTLPAESMQKE